MSAGPTTAQEGQKARSALFSLLSSGEDSANAPQTQASQHQMRGASAPTPLPSHQDTVKAETATEIVLPPWDKLFTVQNMKN